MPRDAVSRTANIGTVGTNGLINVHSFTTQVTETEEVVVNVPSYIEDLGRLLKDTPKRCLDCITVLY